jgi:hypothetical protein
MRIRALSFAAFAAALAALCVGGCGGGGGPTMPEGPDTFTVSASMRNASGSPTILEATIRLDGLTVADSCLRYLQPITDSDGNVIGYSCEAPPAATVTLSGGGNISPGSHRLEFYMALPAQAAPALYTVPPFNLVVKGSGGKPLQTISLPSQTASLGAGGSIVYMVSF